MCYFYGDRTYANLDDIYSLPKYASWEGIACIFQFLMKLCQSSAKDQAYLSINPPPRLLPGKQNTGKPARVIFWDLAPIPRTGKSTHILRRYGHQILWPPVTLWRCQGRHKSINKPFTASAKHWACPPKTSKIPIADNQRLIISWLKLNLWLSIANVD
jgi:hypothetical protein